MVSRLRSSHHRRWVQLSILDARHPLTPPAPRFSGFSIIWLEKPSDRRHAYYLLCLSAGCLAAIGMLYGGYLSTRSVQVGAFAALLIAYLVFGNSSCGTELYVSRFTRHLPLTSLVHCRHSRLLHVMLHDPPRLNWSVLHIPSATRPQQSDHVCRRVNFDGGTGMICDSAIVQSVQFRTWPNFQLACPHLPFEISLSPSKSKLLLQRLSWPLKCIGDL